MYEATIGAPRDSRRCLALGLLAAILVLLVARPPATGADLTVEDFGERWRWRTFDREENLPTGTPTAIGRDRDDVLYVGTATGLYRYDGYEWARIPSVESREPFPIVRIVESDDQLYVATPQEVWSVLYGMELHLVHEGGPCLVEAGPDGAIHVIDLEQRVQFQIGRDGGLGSEGAVPRAPTRIFDYVVDERRIHWLATSAGLYRRDLQQRYNWRPDNLLAFSAEGVESFEGLPCHRILLVKYVRIERNSDSHLVTASGATEYELWARIEDRTGAPRLLRRRAADLRWEEVTVGGVAIEEILRDGLGNYYAVDKQGELFFSGGGERWQRVEDLGLGQVRLHGGVVDAYGLVWYGFAYSMGVGGVAWFDPLSRRWERIGSGEEAERRRVLSLLQTADGAYWTGTVEGLFRSDDEGVRSIGDTTGLALEHVTGLAEDARGRVWASSGERFTGAYHFGPGGAPPGRLLPAQNIFRIVSGRRRDLWFLSTQRTPDGSGYRLYRLAASPFDDDDRLEPFDVVGGRVNDFLEAQDGTCWAATETGLLHLSRGAERLEHIAAFGVAEGLRSPRIWALTESPADGSIWICYAASGAGVSRVAGASITNFDHTGLASPNVWSIAATRSNTFGSRIWFGTDRGLSCFHRDGWYNFDLASLHPQATPALWTLYISPYTAPTEGEVLGVGTLGAGAYRFRLENPRRPRFLRQRPAGEPVSFRQHGDGAVTFEWNARDFKDQTPPDRLLFRYRIDQEPWSDFMRERSARLEGLAPGAEHTFQLEVRDEDGKSPRDQMALKFPVPARPAYPAWLGGVALAVGLAVASLLVYAALKYLRWREPAYRLRRAFAGTNEAVLILDRRGRVVEFNGSGREFLGIGSLAAGEVVGLPADMVPALRRPEVQPVVEAALAGRSGRCDVEVSEAGHRRLRVQGLPLSGRRGQARGGAVLIVEDDTAPGEERELAARRRRLQALRDLVARLGRELAELPGGADAGGLATRDRARLEGLLAALEEFAGAAASPTSEGVSPGEIVDELVGRRTAPPSPLQPPPSLVLPRGVEVDFRQPPGSWLVAVGRDGLRRALGEVLRNAAEAMPEGGRITVRLANRRADAARDGLAPGRYVSVTVSDTGSGMDRERLARAFDPLYTTKTEGGHRGVGLSITYGIVERHGGAIRLRSTPERGTEVEIWLPAAAGAVEGA